jgi:RTX calcium-binding nonapeptide repeat (4 copies)
MKTVLVAAIVVTSVASVAPAVGQVDPIDITTDGTELAGAIVQSESILADADFETTSAEHANATTELPLTLFPTDGDGYGIMTTGDARLVDDARQPAQGLNSQETYRGNTDYDVSVLQIDLEPVPDSASSPDCLSLDFQFLSEEFPRFVNDPNGYNDAFIAELDPDPQTQWTTSDQEIVAPRNFAFDAEGNVVSINSTGIGGMSAANAAGTAYEGSTDPEEDIDGGATALLRATTSVTPGSHSVVLSIFDQGDNQFDSAVFLDNLQLFKSGPGGCEEGAAPVPCFPPSVEGTEGGNKLAGTNAADKILALGGRDSVDALAGPDEVCGGGAGDYLYGRGGADRLLGEDGNDRLYGGDQADVLEGGLGHDVFIPGLGTDVILAQDGDVDCIQRRSGDEVQLDAGVDLVNPRNGCAPGFWL